MRDPEAEKPHSSVIFLLKSHESDGNQSFHISETSLICQNTSHILQNKLQGESELAQMHSLKKMEKKNWDNYYIALSFYFDNYKEHKKERDFFFLFKLQSSLIASMLK